MEKLCSNKRKKPEEIYKSFKSKIIPKYFCKNGWRFVEGYPYVYRVFAKKRWLGMKIIEVLKSEFCLFSNEYYRTAINEKKILVNGEATSEDYCVKDNDVITHSIIRSEGKVLDSPIPIIYQDLDLIVFDKPSSIPVHACGNFHFNCLTKIAKNEMKLGKLFLPHRIDRQTSGICICTKNAESCNKIANLIQGDTIHKIYFAIALGKFDQDEIIVKNYIYSVSAKE